MRTESGKINCCSKVAKYHDDVSAWQLCGFCQKNPKHQFPTQSKYLLCFLKYIHFWQLNDSFTITITFRKYHFDGVWFSGQANASNVCPNPTLTWGRIMLTTLTWTLTRCHIQLFVGGYESVKTKYVTGYKTLKDTTKTLCLSVKRAQSYISLLLFFQLMV